MREATLLRLLRLNLATSAAMIGVMAATAMPAFTATSMPIPSIDASSLSAGLAMLAAAPLVRSRRA